MTVELESLTSLGDVTARRIKFSSAHPATPPPIREPPSSCWACRLEHVPVTMAPPRSSSIRFLQAVSDHVLNRLSCSPGLLIWTVGPSHCCASGSSRPPQNRLKEGGTSRRQPVAGRRVESLRCRQPATAGPPPGCPKRRCLQNGAGRDAVAVAKWMISLTRSAASERLRRRAAAGQQRADWRSLRCVDQKSINASDGPQSEIALPQTLSASCAAMSLLRNCID